MGLLEIVLLGLYFIELIGFFGIGFLVILRKKTPLYRAFAAFALLVGMWQLLQFLAQIVSANHSLATGLLHASIVVAGPMAVSFAVFTSIYTNRRPHYFLLYVTGVLVGLLTLFSEGIKDVEINYLGIGVPQVDGWYGLLLAFGAACILSGVLSIFLRLKKTTDKRQREQDLVILVTMFSVGLLVIFSSFYTSDFSQSVIAKHLVPAACLIAMVSFLYAIYRGLFDIHFFVFRALAYLSTLFMLTTFFVVPVVLLFAYFIDFQQKELALVIIVCSSVVLLYFLQFMRRLFDNITRKFFFRQFYNPQDVLDRLSYVLARTIEIDVVRRQSRKILVDALKPHFLHFLLLKPKNPRNHKLLTEIAGLSSTRSNVIVADEAEEKDKDVSVLKQEKIALVVKLHATHEELGYLLLGYRRSGEPYTNRDIRLLNTVADELVLAVQNALRFEEITRFNETLQGEVNDATKKLRESNRKLRALDEAKDEFISMASHQLRTPLTSVKGYVSMVLDGDAGKLSTDQRKLLEEAYASSQRMVYMIADFLNVSRLKTGKFLLEPSTVNLTTIVEEEIDQLQAAAKGRRLQLVADLQPNLPMLKLDETKIRQVIMNFIDNAIFYSRAGGIITIELSTSDRHVTFMVKDTGIGVPTAEKQQVFSKFFRASNAMHVRPDGTGIGLFMAKKVVTAHGGEMIFESQEGVGSTFGFTLPLKTAAGLPRQAAK